MTNSNYIVSARKYRPASWSTVVGQEALTHTLKSAIDSERLAHAYLFCGPRGVGKTTCARIFAKTINCLTPTADGEACNECELCRAFNEQRSYNITELDAASNNSVDDIRSINEQVRIPPQTGRYRVFIIDEVHMLTTAAFNAFLKTLEEPPEYAIFILATTEKQKVIPTILSRCQIYDFQRITVPDIVKQLQHICEEEHIEAEPAALNVIAQKADGGMRDALSIFDQVTASCEGHITYRGAIENLNVLDYDYYFKLVEAFIAGDVPQALLIFRDIREKGFDAQFFINGLGQHVRDLMVAKTPQTHSLLEMNEEVAQMYVSQAARVTPRFLYQSIELCSNCDLNYRNSTSKQLLVELTLIKMCQIMNPLPQDQPTQQPQALKKVVAPQAQPQQPAPVQQQAQAQAQAQQATTAPRPVYTRAPQVSTTGRILVNATPAATQPPKDPAQPSAPAPEAPGADPVGQSFSDDQLREAWNGYIMANPNEHVIVNTMRQATPKRVNDTTYEIEVQNPSQVEFLNDAMARILSHLRAVVNNESLAINVKVSDKGPAPHTWTPREIAEDMQKRNPKFAQFIKDFELGLA